MVLALACLLRKVPAGVARMSSGSESHSLTNDSASHSRSYATFVEILNKGVMGQWQLIWHAFISEGMPAVWHTCDKMHVVCVLQWQICMTVCQMIFRQDQQCSDEGGNQIRHICRSCSLPSSWMQA